MQCSSDSNVEKPSGSYWPGNPAWLGFLLLLFSMCGCGEPFTINPKAAVPPAAATMPANRVGPLSLSVERVKDEDFLYEAFDSNLIMAGILPVWVEVTNNGEAARDLKKSECLLAGPNGATYRRLDPAKAYKKLLSYYQIKAYTLSGYKHSRNDFDSTALDLASPFPPGGSREGYLFFAVPPDIARGAGLKFIMRKMGESAGRADQSIQIDL
jgi:hypothetical protein